MSGLYDEMCNMFIKPVRQTYSDYDLGPFAFGKYGMRQNFSFQSHKGYQIKTSFFKNKNHNYNTCIIYLHSFNGSRLQSLRHATQMVQKGFHFCSFDFAGCGNSGGQYVSLGCNQKWDVLKLIVQLKAKYGVTQYFLWGRSMGAVTAIKFYSLLAQKQANNIYTDISVIGLVLDSAFISLKRMVIEVGKNRLAIPQFLIKAVLLMVRSSIEQKAQFKFEDLQLDGDIESIRCSTLLIASKQDTFVGHSHSQQIFSKLKLHENKYIQYTRGQHYQGRDQRTINSIYDFFDKKYKRFNDLQTKMNHLRQSRTNGISRVKDLSIQKPSKSLRKYQPKVKNSQKIENIINEKEKSNKIMLFRSKDQQNEPKLMQSTQFYLAGSQKKLPQMSCELVNKQYQTQKKITQPYIKILVESSKETKHKNELQSKSKPNLIYRIDNKSNIRHRQQELLEKQVNKSTERTLQISDNQENHCNVISDKLRKKGKHHKQQHQIDHINQRYISSRFKEQYQKPKAKIKFILSNQAISTPVNMHQNQKVIKKPSMTAQQYKNSQIKIIKGIVTLSPNIKKRQQKTSCTDLKVKAEQQNKNIEQSKSMNNLISLGRHNRVGSYSNTNLNAKTSQQLHQQKAK